MTGGLNDEELDCLNNKTKLTYCIKSRWFDVTGSEDDDFTDRVAFEYWDLIEDGEEMRFAHADITAVKNNIERIQSKFAKK